MFSTGMGAGEATLVVPVSTTGLPEAVDPGIRIKIMTDMPSLATKVRTSMQEGPIQVYAFALYSHYHGHHMIVAALPVSYEPKKLNRQLIKRCIMELALIATGFRWETLVIPRFETGEVTWETSIFPELTKVRQQLIILNTSTSLWNNQIGGSPV